MTTGNCQAMYQIYDQAETYTPNVIKEEDISNGGVGEVSYKMFRFGNIKLLQDE